MPPIRSLILVGSMLLLGACGGGGGAGGAQNPGTPTGLILFPPMNALATTETLVIRGVAAAPGSSIDEVRVNGVLATTSDAFANWQAVVPLTTGANTVEVAVTNAEGQTNARASRVEVERQGVLLDRAIAMDAGANGELIAIDFHEVVVGVATPGGESRPISNADVGSGPTFFNPVDIATDSAASVAYVLDFTDFVRVDLITGVRSDITMTGTPFGIGSAIGLDATGAVALVVESAGDVYRVDLATSAATLLSPRVNLLPAPYAVLVLTNQAIVHSAGLIQAINLTTGLRTTLSQSNLPQTGTGPDLATSGDCDLVRDPTDATRLLALTGSAVLAIDAATGDRTTISGDGVGSGPDIDDAKSMVAVPGGVYVLQERTGILFVDVVTGARSRLTDYRVGAGAYPGSSESDVAVDPASGVVLMADSGRGPIKRVDPTTGLRTAIPGTDDAERVTYDPAGGRAYFMTDMGEIFSLDVASAVVREVSGGTVGAGPAFVGLEDLSHGPTPGTLVVNDDGLGVVLVDIASGARSILTPRSDFTGSNFVEPFGVTSDPLTGMVFIADNGDDHVFEIDQAIGMPTDLVDINGLFFEDINDAVFQDFDGNVYVAGEGDGVVVRVTPGTGAAVIVSDDDTGAGPRVNGMYRMDAAPSTGVAFIPDNTLKLVALDLVTGQRVVVAR